MATTATHGAKGGGGATALVVGSLGVVYGDLGTSPLYSIREAFESPSHRLAVDRLNVLGSVSIIVWTLTLIIAVKYVLLVMRAANNGEGGILALTALIRGRNAPKRVARVRTGGLVLIGLFGTALLFGDGMITPAISVLSAVEGVELIRPGLSSAVVPISVVILVALFAIQRFGTGIVGRVSQALISGVFSLTSQAVQLGFAPRTRIVYTSSTARGQIYVPLINWSLMIACVGLVITFGSSARLAAAFGLSVTGTMFITTILFAVYARRRWRWSRAVVGFVAGVLLVVEGAFLLANAFKIPDGGWFPLLAGAVIVLLFTTWNTGRSLVSARIAVTRTPLRTFMSGVARGHVVRVPGTAVVLYSQRETTPPSLAALVRTTGTLHENVYVVAIVIDETPRVHPSRRVASNDLGNGAYHVTLHYGFMEETRVADDLETHLQIHPPSTDYVLGRESVHSSRRPGMARWREMLYALMVRNASDVATSFHLPVDRVFEVGTRVEI